MENAQEPIQPDTTWQTAARLFRQALTPLAILIAVVGLILLLSGLTRRLSLHGAGSLIDTPTTQPGTNSTPIAGSSITALTGGSLEQIILNRDLIPYTVIPDRPPTQVITYTVQPGDTVSGIASRFYLDRSTIYWGNINTLGGDVHMLRTGMDLYILPVDGVYHVADGIQTLQWIADNYLVDVERIIDSSYNDLAGLTPGSIPNWGTQIVVPGGTGPMADWRSPILETRDASGRVVQAFMPNMPGSCGTVPGGRGTGTWVNPVPGGYLITSVFDGFHSGIDLANNTGTPIVAADNGVVIFAGWVNESWGYGQLVVLDHGGWTTYYAHLSEVSVYCGQGIFQGQQIGLMGSTGWSTGPHLHFEMRWNHIPDNPASYIPF
nr:peptidoglycan DD-metalloendopeptidase family protein [Anaerolineae bacterium]